MASVTLAESAKLTQNMLVAGIIENIVTVDAFYDILPFHEIEGNALAYNRENVLGDVQNLGVGGTITAKAAATFTQITTSLTTLIGDAEVNNLIQATRSNITDQEAAQIASKAKSIGRSYRDQLVNGDGTSDTIEGLLSLVSVGQTVGAVATDGDDLSFDVMDNLMDLVVDKGGQVDYFMMHSRTIRSYFALLRGLGGAGIGETVQLPGGRTVPTYRGVPIFRNDNLPTDQTTGATNTTTSFLAGTLDDGSMTVGISGLTARGEAGIRVAEIGESETKDETITRIKFYNGLALFSDLGLAMASGIKN